MRPMIAAARARFSGARADLWPPLVAFLAGWSLVALRAPGRWTAVFDPQTFTHRDAFQYLKIARHGYQATTNCAGVPRPDVHLCGNVTWFPGYPGVIRVVAVTGLRYAVAGLLIAWVCWYLTLLMVWVLSGGNASRTPTRWACLALAAFFPGQVYFAAIFPISLVTFATLLCVYWCARAPQLLRRVDYLRGFATGFVAAASYPLAIALAPGLGVGALAVRSRRVRLAMLWALGGVLLGVAAVLIYAQLATGRWNAYFITERQEYGVRTHNPITTLLDRYHRFRHPATSLIRVTTAQGAFVTVLVVVVIASQLPLLVRVLRKRAAAVDAADLVLLATGCVAWLIPYVGGGDLSIYRSEACLIVLVPLLRRVPWWLVAAAAIAAGLIANQMAPLFFANRLV
ncbi:MAG: hypothetical protein QOC73_1663 [Actinomycetota bacterium]|nr:hypothetical protein [Actinomycetota bacterium]